MSGPAGTAAAAGEFLAHRPMLLALAYRLLGSMHDAEDVLQDAYLRWSRDERSAVVQPRRYLTKVVTRLAVDQLRARQARRESYVGQWLPEPVVTDPSPFGAVDTSDLSIAMLHLLERLTPPQRAVYVLRRAFDLPYEEIAAVVDRSPEGCRQLQRRAEQALRAGRSRFRPGRDEHRRLLAGFVAAAREGDLARLESMLHADAVAWSDGGGRGRAARRPGGRRPRRARFFAGIYRPANAVRTVPVELNGAPALFVSTARSTHVLLVEIDRATIVGLYLVADPDKIARVAQVAG